MFPWITHANACRVWPKFVCDNAQILNKELNLVLFSLKLINRMFITCPLFIWYFIEVNKQNITCPLYICYITSQHLANTFTLIGENTF